MSESTVTIPIADIFAVLSKRLSGGIELSFRSSIDGSAMPVPNELEVLTSRFGVIETSFNNGFSYVLGFHDVYTVRYLDKTITITPITVMDIVVAQNVDTAADDQPTKDATNAVYSDWCRVTRKKI